MDTLELLTRSEPDLKQWVLHQDTTSLQQTFDAIWTEIRGSRPTCGQPRSATSATSVELARIAERIADFSGDAMLHVGSWRMLSLSLNANEQYEESLPFYHRAISKLEEMGDPGQAARTSLGYVAALFHAGKYEEALQVAATAKRWFLENNDELYYARLCTNQANIYHRMCDFQQAYTYHLMAFSAFEKIGDQQALAQSSLNLALALQNTDQFEKSDEMYEKSEKLSLALGMSELWAQASYNRAYLHYLRGRYSDAFRVFGTLRPHFEQSGSRKYYALCDMDEAEIYVQLNLSKDASILARRAAEQFGILGLRHEHAKSLAFLGVALIQLGRPTDALEVFQISRKEFETEGNLYWVGLLDLYRTEVHLSLKRLWEAKSLATGAKERFDQIGIPSKKILSLVLLGRISLDLKDIPAAENYIREISELTQETNLPLLLFPYYLLCGDIAEKKEDWDDAERFFEMAAQDLEVHQSRLHHDDLRVTFFSGRHRAYEELVCLKLRQADPEKAIREGYAWCEHAKSRGLIELLAHHLPNVQTQAEHSLLPKINRLREELNILYTRSQPELRPVNAQSNIEAITDKETELAHSLREISQSDPEYVSLQQVSTETLDSVRRMLPEDTTIVEYFVAGDEVIAFVMSRSEASVERHLCPLSRIVELQQRLGFQLEKFLLGQQYLDAHNEQIFLATQRYLGELHLHLIARLRDRIRTPKLTIVPHGILHLLPFHAFFDGAQYLIDDFDISYAPSASVLRYCLEKHDLENENPVLVGVADENVPFVEDEIRTISQMFPDARVLLNAGATRDAFAKAVETSGFLHIATHAVFRQDNPMFSGFKLSDGWLTASDLFSMSCQTNLVVLSGCKSGMSQVTGSDDLVGLMRGFLYAGARSLLVSLWNVDDQMTSKLMTLFYDCWRSGSTRSGALANAMKSIRRSHPNPFYWAPFLLVGKG